jgi:hypothetical protein
MILCVCLAFQISAPVGIWEQFPFLTFTDPIVTLA